ncbi:MAG: nucleotidyltransferase family protein [Syntrophomonadaceae bacterium]|nr:nucleotidyltransferase family protein [Syntrophomonadaceae bacterium]MDD3024710.1 nucleotidyltransferase family protein [Syntrophomonadaceae bacterium]
MYYDAVILAGGENSSELKKIAPYDNEALIIIGKYPMVYYVYHALRNSSQVAKIVISGPTEALRNIFSREENLFFVDKGANAVESLASAVNFLNEVGTGSRILVTPTDIPFITVEAIDDFIECCEQQEADFYYPLISKEVNEKRFPGVARTYVKLKDGTFTGGNLFILRKEIIDRALDKALQLVERRKSPLAMARLFGFSLVWKLLTRRLSIETAEKRFAKVIGINGKAIISTYAEVGVDVDKPSDLEIAQKYLVDIDF